MLVGVAVLAVDQRVGVEGAAAVLTLVEAQVVAVDRHFGFEGAPAVLTLVEAQVLAVDRRFVFEGAAAVLMQVLGVDRRFCCEGVAAVLTLLRCCFACAGGVFVLTRGFAYSVWGLCFAYSLATWRLSKLIAQWQAEGA